MVKISSLIWTVDKGTFDNVSSQDERDNDVTFFLAEQAQLAVGQVTLGSNNSSKDK
jgi:hypothetical protein